VFRPAEDAELSVEVDPRVTTKEHIDTFAEFGFNRLSLGVQDFSPEVQEAVERVQSPEQTAEIIEHARKRGYAGINIDLIYGLPYQALETYERTVEEVIRLNPDRVAVYSFAYVPWMRAHMKKMNEDALPSSDTKLGLFCTARDGFLDAGYEAIGMDHFARASDELAVARREGRLRRNFQGYTVMAATDVLGLGISAIGDLRGAYLQNHKKLSDYKLAVEAGHLPLERGIVRSQDDEVRRDVIHDLMCNFIIDIRRIEQEYGIHFEEYFEPDLADLAQHEKEGMVEIGENEIRATPLGGVFVRNLAMCFDRYWRQEHAAGTEPLFSRTV
jgi:oxygen-independent coproporphyrinogen-3 oxidase